MVSGLIQRKSWNYFQSQDDIYTNLIFFQIKINLVVQKKISLNRRYILERGFNCWNLESVWENFKKKEYKMQIQILASCSCEVLAWFFPKTKNECRDVCWRKLS